MRITIETQPTEPETWPLKDAPDGWLEPVVSYINGVEVLWLKQGDRVVVITTSGAIEIEALRPSSTRPVRRAATPTEIVIRQGARP